MINRGTRLKVGAGLGLALVMLIVLGVIAYRSTLRSVETNGSVVQTYRVLDELHGILATLTQAETQQRGYIITGDGHFLHPYNTAIESINSYVSLIAGMTRNDPVQQQLIPKLKMEIAGKVSDLRKGITARQKGGIDSASQIILSQNGQREMDDVSQVLRQMSAAENRLLEDQTARAAASARLQSLAFAALTLMAAAVVALVYSLILREFSRRQQAEEALNEANKSLSVQIAELDERNREMELMSSMGEILQLCRTVDEACEALQRPLQQLFPTLSGAISLVNPATDLLQSAAAWGECGDATKVFQADECWGLRGGRPHYSPDPESGLRCKHLGEKQPPLSLCMPLIAQGETLGLLHICTIVERGLLPAQQQLVRAVADQVALAVANLQLQETLRIQSIRDPLTGLFNRRYMEVSLEREINRAARERRAVGIVMLDVDHFKRFNDTFGHEAGDLLLRDLGTCLQAHVRAEDIACRYGGEEFTLILPESTLENTTRRAEQLREQLRELDVQYHHRSIGGVTISLGVACFPEHGATGAAVMHQADRALYKAKQEGRNRVIVAEEVR
ncbi:MAG: diguanylate cyclase [Armatimonadota bacterium]|nr:diguanylate cyclase [Armatimonadota bacterium]